MRKILATVAVAAGLAMLGAGAAEARTHHKHHHHHHWRHHHHACHHRNTTSDDAQDQVFYTDLAPYYGLEHRVDTGPTFWRDEPFFFWGWHHD
ncbi:MAG: hypothetical protein KGO53_01250 [Alphaproteobacteria bacterium]|nr:hypothetical protein [Alphaproteobacteria bacterium]